MTILGWWFLSTLLLCFAAGVFFLRVGGRTYWRALVGGGQLLLCAFFLLIIVSVAAEGLGTDPDYALWTHPILLLVLTGWWLSKQQDVEFDWTFLRIGTLRTEGSKKRPSDPVRQITDADSTSP